MRKGDNYSAKVVAVVAMVLVASVVQAVTTNKWKTTCMAPNTPATAYLWNEPSNWDTEQVPAAHDVVEFPLPSNVYYVRVPDEGVMVSRLSSKTGNGNYMILVGGKVTVSTEGSTRGDVSYGSGWMFADLEAGSSTDTTMPYISGVNLAGRAFGSYQNFTPASGWVSHRLDKFAYSSDSVRTEDIVISDSRYHSPGSASVAVYAPPSAAACAGEWILEEGTPYATRSSSTAHPLVPGTIVACEGALPPGTFLKRIFSNSSIELSEAALASGTKTLSFAAFSPEVRLHVKNFSRIGTTADHFRLCKYSAGDVLRYDMTNYSGYSGQTEYFGVPADEAATWFPGTHVFHNINDTGAKIIFLNAVVELAGKTDGTASAFSANTKVSVQSGCTARLVMTNNISGVINTLTNLAGTLVKEGAGTLTACMASGSNKGNLSVQGGTLVLTAKAALGDAPPQLEGLTLGAGAVLQIPSNGLSVATIAAAPGAVVRGPGVLYVRSMAAMLDGVVFEGGATLMCSVGEPGAVLDKRPEGEVVGHPMFWVDASKPETIEYTEENGTNFVTRWNDCRAGEPMFCTNVIRRPVFVNGEDMTNKYVHLRRVVGTPWLTNTETLVWSVPVGGIKAVFLVQDPRDGGGEILGHTSRLPHGQYYGTQGGPYYRGSSHNINAALIASSYATPCVKFGHFYLNGMEVCGYSDHYLGAFSQLVEHHVNTNEYSNGTKHDLWIDAFGMGYWDGESHASGCNGCMRIHEYIIYTNSLTHVERTKVAQHLMRKWLGKDVIWSVSETNAASVASVAAADGRSIDVAEGNSYAVMSLGGAGEIVKTGGGTLYLGNVTNARVTVKGGELLVRSFAPTNTFVPDGAWVHVDASDPASAEISESGGVKYLSKWHNLSAEGGWYGPNDNNSHSAAFYKENAMNGLPVIDTGDLRWSGNSTPTKRALRYVKPDGTRYNKLSDSPWVNSPVIKTMFFAADTAKGGNSLMGGDHNGFPAVGLPHTPSTDFSTPIISAAGHNWGYIELSNEFNKATSIFRTNGVPVNANATPFSGGQDVFSVRLAGGKRGDVLAEYGYDDGVNGIAYGEVLLYRDQLSIEDFNAVEAYFRRKWRGEQLPGFAEAGMDSLVIENGASVRVCGYALSAANPVGTLTVGALGGGGSVAGDVVLAEGGSLVAVVDETGAVGTLTTTGSLDLSRGGSVVFTGEVARLEPGVYTLVSAERLSFGGTWTCPLPMPSRTATLRRSGDDLILNVCARGTLVIFR